MGRKQWGKFFGGALLFVFSISAATCSTKNPADDSSRNATKAQPEMQAADNQKLIDSFVYGYSGELDPNDPWERDLLAKLKTDIRADLTPLRPDRKRMALIPAGKAVLGSEPTGPSNDARWPKRTVFVSAFYIDRNEVDNVQYAHCVAARQCLPIPAMLTITDYTATDRPALLTYKQAERYCSWAGKRLPTENEWEKAARGTDGRMYPWGNAEPTPLFANICGDDCMMPYADRQWRDGYPFTAPVTNFPAGDSPYGLRQTAGNVKEWVATEEVLPPNNFIARGASWYSPRDELLVFYRQHWFPQTRNDDKGVRCALSVERAKN